MRVVLLSTYELGHQPLGIAGPAAVLSRAGHEVHATDLSVEEWPGEEIASADGLVVSVPMHTATQLGLEAFRRARAERPTLPVAFCGLYAGVLEGRADLGPADLLVTGEAGPALLEWISGAGGAASGGPRGLRVVDIGPAVLEAGAPPLRSVLPPLSRYAKHLAGDRSVVAASVEASRGCNHRCRHCPVATVYKGRSRAVPLASIMDDVAQVVEAGAGHISFADPDFLNRPRHALEVAGALHGAFPELTFDATVKVEHVLRHHDIWEELRVAGLSHLVSAFESTDDRVLDILEKGHRALEEREAVRVLRGAGIEVHPSWLPFSPWTTLDSLAGLLELTAEADLVWNTDPVQFSIRLLLPRGSLLLEHPDPVLERALDGADSATGSWNWRHRDPAIDALQAEIAGLVEEYERDEDGSPSDPVRCFKEIWSLTRSAGAPLAGESPPEPDPALASPIAGPGRPRLSETWFCCAEPTVAQLDLLRHR